MIYIISLAVAFNLFCSGVSYSGTVNDGRKGEVIKRDENISLRIDFGSGKWCRGDCNEIGKIEYYDDSEISLSYSNIYPKNNSFHIINRINGSYTTKFSIVEDGGGFVFYGGFAGSCEKGEFSGFPKPKF